MEEPQGTSACPQDSSPTQTYARMVGVPLLSMTSRDLMALIINLFMKILFPDNSHFGVDCIHVQIGPGNIAHDPRRRFGTPSRWRGGAWQGDELQNLALRTGLREG